MLKVYEPLDEDEEEINKTFENNVIQAIFKLDEKDTIKCLIK